MPAFQAAVSSGQYQHSDGIFFGGHQQTWSNYMLRSVLSDYLADAEIVGVIDFHTGLGPYGYGELIAIGTPSQKALSAQWYGEQLTDPEVGTSTSSALDGMIARGISETLSETDVSFITIEFGTRDIMTVLTALRADNWLAQNVGVDSELANQIKKDIKEAFYPDAEDWKEHVWARTCETVQLAITGVLRR